MDVVYLIGRILFAAVFISGAVGHLKSPDAMAAYAEAKGVKPGKLAVYGSALWMLVASALLVVGAWADLGALMLAIFVLPTAFLMHGFWKETDEATKAAEMLHFHKDLSLGGAALALFALLAAHGACVGLQLTKPLFDVMGH